MKPGLIKVVKIVESCSDDDGGKGWMGEREGGKEISERRWRS